MISREDTIVDTVFTESHGQKPLALIENIFGNH